MKFKCRVCNAEISLDIAPKYCPFCAADKPKRVKENARNTALQLIERHNALTKELDIIMEKYAPLYLERETIRSTLRTYKARGIISDDEMPDMNRTSIMQNLSAYRKQRKK